MSVTAMERLDLENSLRKALQNDEFVLHYQPMVEIHKNEVAGVECLLRWQHPEKGIIEPEDFVEVAEDSGLIIPIGEWVIRTVCRQIKQWHSAGLEQQSVSINISPRQFRDQDVVGLLKRELADSGVDASCINVDIAESTLIENIGEVEKVLAKLHDMGMSIAINDFGTGFASVAYLKDFSIDVIKLDHSLISAIPDSEADSAIVTAVAGLTRGLKLKLLAVGVENERQLQMLKGLGCQLGQGNYWSKPLPADQYEQFYLNRFYNLG
jgi:EAL domain-containing protein (putative c-di-GMP-specific phosphodiesterase class I)